MKKRCDAVFEGGGVRGIGLVGAVYQMERSGYTFGNVAGSSAGAIILSSGLQNCYQEKEYTRLVI